MGGNSCFDLIAPRNLGADSILDGLAEKPEQILGEKLYLWTEYIQRCGRKYVSEMNYAQSADTALLRLQMDS